MPVVTLARMKIPPSIYLQLMAQRHAGPRSSATTSNPASVSSCSITPPPAPVPITHTSASPCFATSCILSPRSSAAIRGRRIRVRPLIQIPLAILYPEMVTSLGGNPARAKEAFKLGAFAVVAEPFDQEASARSKIIPASYRSRKRNPADAPQRAIRRLRHSNTPGSSPSRRNAQSRQRSSASAVSCRSCL